MAALQKSLIFLKGGDILAVQINKRANELLLLLQNFDTNSLVIQPELKSYFINHHLGKRLYFSIQNSAHIIYEAVKKTNKPTDQINIVDYGAGLGTLYLLAGMLQFKKVVYNDYLPDWKDSAEAIAHAIDIKIDGYVTGDIDAIILYAESEKFTYDIIASRNVIEHIYSLPFFYKEVYKHNPNAVIYSTTSANFHNPAMWLKHYLLHKKIERTQYLPQRKLDIQKEWPGIDVKQLSALSKLTRGKASNDFLIAINKYRNNQPNDKVLFLRSNTCTTDTGYWCEHLLTKNEYEQIIMEAGFSAEFSAGYWDTHYAHFIMNVLGKFLNKVIGITGKNAILFSPFVNVVATKKQVSIPVN